MAELSIILPYIVLHRAMKNRPSLQQLSTTRFKLILLEICQHYGLQFPKVLMKTTAKLLQVVMSIESLNKGASCFAGE